MKQLLFNALLLASICPMNYGMQQVAIKPPVQTGTYFTPRKIVVLGALGALGYMVYRRYKLENKLAAEYNLRSMADTGNMAAIKMALTRARKWGADINAADDRGNTALVYAIKQQRIDVIKLLREHGARILFDRNDKRAKVISVVLNTYTIEIVKIFARQNDERQRLKSVFIIDPQWRNTVNNIIDQAETEAKRAAEQEYIDRYIEARTSALGHNSLISI